MAAKDVGAFEKHNKGFGSKMLEKFGWKAGKSGKRLLTTANQ
jgi:hypothetical protein